MRLAGAVLIAAVLIIQAVMPGSCAAEPRAQIHHEAKIRIDPDSRQLTISDVISVSGRAEIHLQLAPWIKIETPQLDQEPIPLPASSESWRLGLPDTGHHQVALNLQGKIPAQKTGHGTEQGAALGPEGGFLFGGSGWLPYTGDDWISYRLHVEVPAPYRAVATGHLGNEIIGKKIYSAKFFGAYPAASSSLFFGPYDERERRHDKIRILIYFHRDLAEQTDDYLRDSARYLTRYLNRIGPYPYKDFHVISAPIQVGLGFPNLTYIGRRIIPLPFIHARSLAHEVLHNWWGNGVRVDYRKGNWSEGLTTYMADYALAAENDTKRGRQMRLGWLRDYAALPIARDIPVNQFTAKHNDAAQVIGYNKVAFIFHMLKQELGDATFSAALRVFWQQQKNRMASWEDLRHAFESESGRDLQWFFKQWLRTTGAPRLHLEQVELTAPLSGGKYRLGFTVRQDPPTYRLTIPVVIETTTGTRRLHIKAAGVRTATSLETDSQPLALHIDRTNDLFRRLSRGEAPYILRDVTLAQKVITVIAAKDKTMYAIAHNLAGRGTSRVWTAYGAGNNPILVVEADNAEALQALLRPLPHYGRRSYMVFEGRRAIDKGIWPAENSPLSHRFN